MITATPVSPAPSRVALVGNYSPRRCGIATFTHDLRTALAAHTPDHAPLVVALTDDQGPYAYPDAVSFEIAESERASYVAAADYLNFTGVDLVLLQHEFGIFGGEAGSHVLELLRRLTMPVVTTLHTVLTDPDPAQRRVMEALVARSSRLVVMAEVGRTILVERYGVVPGKVEVIPHGVPDQPFLDSALAKESLGFGDRDVLLTFGLLGPGKGIEVMLDALPTVVAKNPDALYVVLGATHPNLVRNEGERYRDTLKSRADVLGVSANVAFIDKFVHEPELLEAIAAADIYVTPYLNEAQITSGTLAISFGMGKPIVSTPYWHARELLADGRGMLVPFGDVAAMAAAINAVLGDRVLKSDLRKKSYAAGRATIWPVVAERHATLFAEVVAERLARADNVLPLKVGTRHAGVLPRLSLEHLEVLTDSAGLTQHAILSVPDRNHGYCLDDNARALLLMVDQRRVGVWGQRETRLALIYAAFVQHAWRPELSRFRNFMGFDRTWLEEVGADDAHGRAVWALGALAEHGATRQLDDWATALLLASAPACADLWSPRAWAFGVLGATAFGRRFAGHRAMARLRDELAGRLRALLVEFASDDWVWFEDRLAYDNARLCHALIEAGRARSDVAMMDDGLRTLGWLMGRQSAPAGHFRPVGTDSFGRDRLAPLPFDQQALEVSASVGACLAAFAATGEAKWRDEASRAFAWFMGANDLRVMMTDAETGAGYDGLHPDRRNANQGAESTLAYLQSLSDMLALRAAAGGELGRVA